MAANAQAVEAVNRWIRLVRRGHATTRLSTAPHVLAGLDQDLAGAREHLARYGVDLSDPTQARTCATVLTILDQADAIGGTRAAQAARYRLNLVVCDRLPDGVEVGP